MKDRETEIFVLRSCIERDGVSHLSEQALHFVHLSCLGLSVMAGRELLSRRKTAGQVESAPTDVQHPQTETERKCGATDGIACDKWGKERSASAVR